jgi:hypothetical protein
MRKCGNIPLVYRLLFLKYTNRPTATITTGIVEAMTNALGKALMLMQILETELVLVKAKEIMTGQNKWK